MDEKDMDHWAEYCDVIWADNDQDVEFYRTEARKAKGRILEVACGSGRIYLEILKEGRDIYGIDISSAILKTLGEKAGRQGLKPRVYKADMRSFKLDHRFSQIIVPFRSFLCNLTTEDQIKTLMCIKKHLLPRGQLILDIFYPSMDMLSAIRENRVVKRDIRSISRPKYRLRNQSYFIDEPNRIIGWTTKLYRSNRKIWEGDGAIALLNKRQFESLLSFVGFKKWELFGDFDYNPLGNYKKDMVWIIENEG